MITPGMSMVLCNCGVTTGGLVIHLDTCPFYVPLGLVMYPTEPHDADLRRLDALEEARVQARIRAALVDLRKKVEGMPLSTTTVHMVSLTDPTGYDLSIRLVDYIAVLAEIDRALAE